MPILGAVATLASRPDDRVAALRVLAEDPRLELGELAGLRLPLVIETESRDDDRVCWAELHAVPGVIHLDLVFADFSDLCEPQEEPR